MHRPNYNYNYGTSTSVQKPSSHKPTNTTYITSSKPLYEPLFNHHPQSKTQYHMQEQLPMKYYPIINETQPYNLNANKTTTSATQSTSSFYVNQNKQSKRQFALMRTGEMFDAVKSPKSNDNWQNVTENNISNTASNLSILTQNKNDVSKSIKLKESNTNNKVIEKYVDWLYEAFGQFEKSGNVKILKEINEKNSKETVKLFEQLYGQKENLSNEQQTLPQPTSKSQNKTSPQSLTIPQTYPTAQTNPNFAAIKSQLLSLQQQSSTILSSLKKQQLINQQLQQQLIQQIQIKQGRNLNQSQIRQQNHVNQMQQSIVQLEEEIRLLEKKNNQITKNIIGVTFFKEWNLMFQEAKGATKLTIKLRHQIQKREELIKELTNEDPSNTSDARSAKRNLSENGEKAQPNFLKKDTKISHDPSLPKPSTPIRPSSQAAHKFVQKPDSGRSSNDVVIRHLSHSNRFSQSKKTTVNNSVDKTKERKQSYDQKQHGNTNMQWKGLGFPGNLKNFGMGFIGKDVTR